MAFSRVTKIGDGTSTQFPVNFTLGYIDPSHITARVGNEVDGLGNPVYRTITFLGPNLLQISGAPAGIGVKIVFERTVPKDELLVDFSNGDVLDEVNLDISQLQTIMAVQEVLDGRFATISQDLDFGTFTGVNTRAPTAPGDLANKQYVDSVTGFLATEIPTVQAELDAAVADANAAKNASQTNATNAANSASAAAASAASIDLAAINTSINTRYAKTGGTLTGNVEVSKTNPIITLNKAASGQFNILRGQTNGVLRWDFVLGDDSVEGGSNGGSIASLNRYSDAGTFLGYGFTVRRSDGYFTIPGQVEVCSPGASQRLYIRKQVDPNEGGELVFEKSSASTLSGLGMVVDLSGDTFRVFEDGGSFRGFNLNLTQGSGGIGTSIVHSNNLRTQLAAITAGEIGSYGFMRDSSSGTAPNASVAGSTLFYAANTNAGSIQASGTWRCHGQTVSTGQVTLFQRTA